MVVLLWILDFNSLIKKQGGVDILCVDLSACRHELRFSEIDKPDVLERSAVCCLNLIGNPQLRRCRKIEDFSMPFFGPYWSVCLHFLQQGAGMQPWGTLKKLEEPPARYPLTRTLMSLLSNNTPAVAPIALTKSSGSTGYALAVT